MKPLPRGVAPTLFLALPEMGAVVTHRAASFPLGAARPLALHPALQGGVTLWRLLACSVRAHSHPSLNRLASLANPM